MLTLKNFRSATTTKSPAIAVFACAVLLLLGGCSQRAENNTSYRDGVKHALEQAELTEVSVSEDAGKNIVTLGGKVHSADAKVKALQVAQAAAGTRVIVNEISVQPVGAEADARSMASDLDDAIEKNYKAALISNGLNKEHINFTAKNGVLQLTGSVQNAKQRQVAEKVAAGVPNVQQVLNQIEVKR